MPRPEGPARAPNPGTPGWAVDSESGRLRSGPGHAQVPSGKLLETPRKQARAGVFPALEDTLHTQEVPRASRPRPQAAPLRLPRTLGTEVMHQPRGTVTGRAGPAVSKLQLEPRGSLISESRPQAKLQSGTPA